MVQSCRKYSSCVIDNSYAGSDRFDTGGICMEQHMLRYLFEGYADTIVLATTLRVRPAKPAPNVKQFRSALEFVEVPSARAPGCAMLPLYSKACVNGKRPLPKAKWDLVAHQIGTAVWWGISTAGRRWSITAWVRSKFWRTTAWRPEVAIFGLRREHRLAPKPGVKTELDCQVPAGSRTFAQCRRSAARAGLRRNDLAPAMWRQLDAEPWPKMLDCWHCRQRHQARGCRHAEFERHSRSSYLTQFEM